MKKLSLLGFISLLATVVAGCPIFDGESSNCNGSFCETETQSGCRDSRDCQQNETCGTDQQCHSGDCTVWGCSAGFSCTVDSSQIASCTVGGGSGGSGGGAGGSSSTGGSGGAVSSTGGSGGGATTSTGGSGGATTTATTTTTTTGTGGSGGATSTTGTGGSSGAVVRCANANDCSTGHTCAPNGTCQPGDCTVNGCIFGYTCGANGACTTSNPATCAADSECGTALSCVSGLCTQASDLCFDHSQCDPGDKCVGGKCTITCSSNANCRDGFNCDTTLGVCTTASKTCAVTNDCGSASSVCVAGACVPRSTSGASCNPGDVWAENGCIPNQSAVFACATDGQAGDGTAGKCAVGSICIHRSCYTDCTSNGTACTSSTAPQCVPVTSSSGSHAVCAAVGTTFATDCDPTTGKTCTTAGTVCIDGACK